MKTRNPAIDCLRFLAIFLVVGVHFIFLSKLSLKDPVLFDRALFVDIFRNGYLGVTIFFVTSGYLITNILLMKSTFHLKDFYTKRAAKILPPLVMLVIFAFLLYNFSLIDRDVEFDKLALLWSILTVQFNFFYLAGGSGVLALAVLWSLSIEELFYLLFPPIVKFNFDKLVVVLSVLVIVGPIARATIGFDALFLQFGCFDAIAFGALTAIGVRKLDSVTAHLRELAINNDRNAQAIVNLMQQLNVTSFIIGIFLLSYFLIKYYVITDFVLLPTATAFATALILVGCRHWRYPASVSFGSKYLLPTIGIYSYEIYLFHMLIILSLQKSTLLGNLPMDISFVVVFSVIVAVSVVIYKFYSLPAQRSVISFLGSSQQSPNANFI
jgi:peptidoglycan/LPS O-acetylase OafA/YrhL